MSRAKSIEPRLMNTVAMETTSSVIDLLAIKDPEISQKCHRRTHPKIQRSRKPGQSQTAVVVAIHQTKRPLAVLAMAWMTICSVAFGRPYGNFEASLAFSDL